MFLKVIYFAVTWKGTLNTTTKHTIYPMSIKKNYKFVVVSKIITGKGPIYIAQLSKWIKLKILLKD